jgi:hypothetical protein
MISALRLRRTGAAISIALVISLAVVGAIGCGANSGELSAAQKAAKASAAGFASWEACVHAGACSE